MAKSFLTSIQLNNNSLLNAKVDARWASTPSGTSNPDGTGTATAGQISSYNGSLYIYSGSAWVQVGSATISGSGLTFNGSTSGSTVLKAAATAGSGTLTLPTATGTLVGTGDTGVVTNTMLQNSTISGKSLGSNLDSLTFGTGLTAGGSSYNGSAAVTITAVTGSTSVAGILQLTDSTSSTSTTTAATPNSVKTAYDLANAALPKSGGTMTGAIAMGTNKITGLGEPTSAQDAATKNYVDTFNQGLNVHDSVYLATTTLLAATYAAGTTGGDGGTGVGATLTFNSTGATTIDGVALVPGVDEGTRILVKDQNGTVTVSASGTNGSTATFTSSGAHGLVVNQQVSLDGDYAGTYWVNSVPLSTTFTLRTNQFGTAVPVNYYSLNINTGINATYIGIANGVYTVTTVGKASPATATVLTRATDFDNSVAGDITAGDLLFVVAGTAYTGAQFVQTLVGQASSPVKSIKIGTDSISFTQFASAGMYTGGSNINISSSKVISLTSSSGSPISSPYLGGTVTLNSGTTFSGTTTFSNAVTFSSSPVITGLTTGSVSNSVVFLSTLTSGSLSLAGGLTSGSLNLGNGTAWTTGTINIGNGASGAPTINIGNASSGNVAINIAGGAGTNTVAIGSSTTTTTVTGAVRLPTVGTSGFVKLGASGALSADTNTYLTSSTGVTTVNGASGAIGATANSNGAITRYYRATNSSGTTTTINHALGQWVLVQVYKTSDGTLVDTDVANTSTSGGTTTITFAASQTAGDYTIVIIG